MHVTVPPPKTTHALEKRVPTVTKTMTERREAEHLSLRRFAVKCCSQVAEHWILELGNSVFRCGALSQQVQVDTFSNVVASAIPVKECSQRILRIAVGTRQNRHTNQ